MVLVKACTLLGWHKTMNWPVARHGGLLRSPTPRHISVEGGVKVKDPILIRLVAYDYSLPMVPRYLAVFILSVPMHCSATLRFYYLYIHKHNSHIYRNVWSFCRNVLNFCMYTYFYLFLRNSLKRHDFLEKDFYIHNAQRTAIC